MQKYREIQPVIKGIMQRNVNSQDALALLEAAIEVAKSDEFIKYNDPDQDQKYHKELQDAVDIIQKSGIKAWFNQLDQRKHSGYDIIYEAYCYICCPEYQRSAYLDLAVSDMTVEYEMIYFGYRLCYLYLPDLLNSKHLSVEMLPREVNDDADIVSIINRDQFTELSKAAEIDVLNLIQLDCESDSDVVENRDRCLGIYKRFNYLLNTANSQTNYTLFMEEHIC